MPYSSLRKGRASLPGQIYAVTIVTHERDPLFADLYFGRIVVRALRTQDQVGHTSTIAFVIMPDHVHWLLQLASGQHLAQVVRAVKGASARTINRCRMRTGPVWQTSFHDRALRSDEDVRHEAAYIIRNPIRAGLVKTVREYSLWDAMWF